MISLERIHELQRQWIHYLQQTLDAEWIKAWFRGCDLISSSSFALVVIIVMWYLWQRWIGIKVFYMLVISLIINALLKDLFAEPRPCQIISALDPHCPSSYGFPSGTAQTVTLLCGIIFIETKKKGARWFALCMAGMLCFSRVYLGAHYPSDIVGGLIVGGSLIVIYAKGERWIAAYKPFLLWLFPVLFLCIGPLLDWSVKEIATWMLSLWAVAWGLSCYKEKKNRPRTGYRNKLIVIGSVFVGLGVLVGIEHLGPGAWWLIAIAKGYWFSFGGERFVSHFVNKA